MANNGVGNAANSVQLTTGGMQCPALSTPRQPPCLTRSVYTYYCSKFYYSSYNYSYTTLKLYLKVRLT
jgi:hypothetical protein